MGTFLARRLLALIPTVLLVTFGVYLLISLVPGDPAQQLAGGTNATPQQIAAVRSQLHLDEPLVSQYWRWLNHAARGDLGNSLFTHANVADEIKDRLPVTASVVLFAVLLGVIFGTTFGVLAGMFPASRTDRGSMFVSSLGLALPNFWVAMLLVLFFAINRSWFPATGYTKFGTDPLEWLRSITLPAFALSIPLSAALARQIRSSLAGTMQENYVKTAWAKGAGVRAVVGKHAMKNASIPAITIVGFALATLLGASVLIEQIFALPGIGSYVLAAIQQNDMPVIQGVALVFVFANIIMALIVDIGYMVVNPKVRVT